MKSSTPSRLPESLSSPQRAPLPPVPAVTLREKPSASISVSITIYFFLDRINHTLYLFSHLAIYWTLFCISTYIVAF